MVKITLDAETFKALASTTRLTVLRALDERRKTLTELSRDLDLNKATVHEHLQLLTAADLIRKRDDEGRKWIYYELTWRGQRLLHPQETTTFNVLLGLGVLAAGGGIAMLGRALGWWLDAHPLVLAHEQPAVGDSSGEQEPMAANSASPSPESGSASASSGPASSSSAAESGGTSPADASTSPDGLRGTAAESHSFLDDGGWLAVALMLLTALIFGLAFLLRRQVRPGRFSPAAAGEAERGPSGAGTELASTGTGVPPGTPKRE